jgi:chromosome segregation ATPase
MELVNSASYTSNNAKKFLSTKSGEFLDEDGNKVTVDMLETKEKLMKKVLNGELGSTTDPRYVKREASYTGDETSSTKAPDHKINFDHIVLEDIPATADIQKIHDVVKGQFKHIDDFYNDSNGRPQLYLGEREIHSRIDKKPNGDYHIHFFVNRHGIVDLHSLQDKLDDLKQEPKPNNDHILAVEKAINFIGKSGCLKGLEQSCDFNDHYMQESLNKKINNALTAEGLAPIGAYSTYAQGKESNVKTTQESKNLAHEVVNSDYDEEVINNYVEKVQDTERVTVLDSVIVSQKLSENKKQLSKLAEEMKRLASESKQLELAQEAITTNENLKEELDTVKADNTKLNEQITELVTTHKKQLEDTVSDLTEKHKEEITNVKTSLNSVIESVKEDLQAKEKEVNELDELLTEQVENNNQLVEEKEILNKSVEKLTLENNQVKSDLEKSKEESVKLANDLATEKEEKLKISAEKDKIFDMFDKVVKAQEQQQKEIELLKEQNAQYQAVVKQEQEKSNQMAIELGNVKQANQQLNSTVTQLTEANNLFKTALDKIKDGYESFIEKAKSLFENKAEFNKQFKEEIKEHKEIVKEVKEVNEVIAPITTAKPSNAVEADNLIKQLQQMNKQKQEEKERKDKEKHNQSNNDNSNKSKSDYKPK